MLRKTWSRIGASNPRADSPNTGDRSQDQINRHFSSCLEDNNNTVYTKSIWELQWIYTGSFSNIFVAWTLANITITSLFCDGLSWNFHTTLINLCLKTFVSKAFLVDLFSTGKMSFSQTTVRIYICFFYVIPRGSAGWQRGKFNVGSEQHLSLGVGVFVTFRTRRPNSGVLLSNWSLYLPC